MPTLAPYAASDITSLGRRQPEEPPKHRSEYQRDRDRIIHSTAFRRLEYKTQVFVNHEGEEFLHLLEGNLEFRSVDRVEVLEAGDSIYFESDLSHSFRCLGEQRAKAIVVVWSK